MTEFTAESVLEITGITDDSLRSARGQIEDEIGGISVDVQANGPGGAGGVGRRRGRGGGIGATAGVGTVEVLMDQTEILTDIRDDIEKLAQSGVGGGGGGGGNNGLLAGLGLGTGAAGGGGLLGGAAVTGGAALAGAGAVIGGSRFALGQGVFGQAGRQTLQGRTRFEGLSGAREAVGNPVDFFGTGMANMLDPTGLGETGLRAAGQTRAGRLAGRVAGAPVNGAAEGFGRDIRQRAMSLERPSWLADLQDPSITAPSWLTTLTDPSIQSPGWLSSLTDPEWTEPAWVQTLTATSSPLSEPAWLSTIESFNPSFNIEEPTWLSDFDSLSAELTVDLLADLELGASQIEQGVRDAFNDVRADLVDDVVQRVRDELTSGVEIG